MHINCAPNRNRWKLRLAGLVASLMATVSAFAVTNIALDNNTAPPAGITALVAENSGGANGVDLTGTVVQDSLKIMGVFGSGQAFTEGAFTGACPNVATISNDYGAIKKNIVITLATGISNALGAPDNVNGPAPNATLANVIVAKGGNAHMDYGANVNAPDTLAIGLKEAITASASTENHAAELANYDNVANGLNVNQGGAIASAFNGDLPNSAGTVTSYDLADTPATHTGTAPPVTVWV